MKIPKQIRKYCPYCKKHTIMKVVEVKKRDRGTLKRGSKERARKRGLNRGAGNKGRYSKGAISKWKMYNKKQSKKTDLRFICSVCKKAINQSKGIRTKKLQIA